MRSRLASTNRGGLRGGDFVLPPEMGARRSLRLFVSWQWASVVAFVSGTANAGARKCGCTLSCDIASHPDTYDSQVRFAWGFHRVVPVRVLPVTL